MSLATFPLALVVLNALWISTRGDAEVSCDFRGSCILQCSFQAGDEVVIHWIQVTAGNARVHSYYYREDQLGLQDQRFRGRTSLFKEQLSRGNASLRLTGVKVQDRGRYKCYTSTITGNKESFIQLHVDAPVHKVDIQRTENKVTCSSGRIYPEPELTWSTSPPSSLALPDKAAVQQTEQQLYNISGSLTLSDGAQDLDISCSVTTHTSSRTATLVKATSISVSESGTTISCAANIDPPTGVIWRFNHSRIIVTQSRAEGLRVSEEWRKHVKGVSETGSLTLQHLSSNEQGIYTCEGRKDEETFLKGTVLTIENKESSHVAAPIVLSALGLTAAVGLLVWFVKRRREKNANGRRDQVRQDDHMTEVSQLNGDKTTRDT